MTVLRCTAKLLKRLKQPAKPPEPAPQANPLGEWYADIDFWHRQPFVVMLNAATGAMLMLHGNAASLRQLHERALLQFAAICEVVGLQGAGVDAELHGFDAGFAFGATRDRSLLASSTSARSSAGWRSSTPTVRLRTWPQANGTACSNTPRWAATSATAWITTARSTCCASACCRRRRSCRLVTSGRWMVGPSAPDHAHRTGGMRLTCSVPAYPDDLVGCKGLAASTWPL